MAADDWKKPFRSLRTKLVDLNRAGSKVYHSVVFFPHYEAMEPQQCEELVQLTPGACSGKEALRVTVTGSIVARHIQLFFGKTGKNDETLQVLRKLLEGNGEWFSRIPKGLVPRVHVPKNTFRDIEDLVRWTCLVYYVASKIDAPYLRYATEAGNDGGSFASWQEWPQPRPFDPLPLLMHQVNSYEEIERWKEEFWSHDLYMPDMIGAHLTGPESGELIAASIAAVDCLLYMIESMKAEELQRKRSESQPAAVKKRTQTERIRKEVALLKAFLFQHHDPRANPESHYIPLTWQAIAEAMQWYNKKGELLQSKTSRRMEEIFGDSPMEKYVSLWGRGKQKGMRFLQNDFGMQSDGIEESDDEDEFDDDESNGHD